MPLLHKARNPDAWFPWRQPRRPVDVDPTHPLSRGLKSVFVWQDRHDPPNLVTGAKIKSVAFPDYMTMVPEPTGMSCECFAYNVYWTLAASADIYAADYTIALIRTRRAVLDSQESFGDATTGATCYLPYSDNVVYLDFPDSGSRVSATMPVANQVANLQERWLFHGGAAGRAIWLDGVQLASSAATTAAAPGSKDFRLNSGATFGGIKQGFALFASWGRQLSDAEIRQWSHAPYGFLMPRG